MSRITIGAIAAVVVFLTCSVNVFAQSKPGVLTGVVRDSEGTGLPGIDVRAVRVGTEPVIPGPLDGLVSLGQEEVYQTKTSDDGWYSLSVPPGEYAISAGSVSGTMMQLGFDFFEVHSGETRSADLSIVELALRPIPSFTVCSCGLILDEELAMPPLPFAGTDPLALVPTLPGFIASPLGHQYDTVGGLPLRTANTVRDGISVSDAFYPLGVGSVTALNHAIVSEIRLILAPVDAETGRGNSQIQITTRSGTNRLRWSTQTHLHNSAFDALGPDPERKKQPFSAALENFVQADGPIVRNRSFFLVNWDQQVRTARSDPSGPAAYLTVPVLTPYARQGIFRFWDGWNSGDASMALPTMADPVAGTWPIYPDGTAVAPRFRADDPTRPYDGALTCFSVFGNVKLNGTPFTAADCGTYIPNVYRGSGDPGNPANYGPDFSNPRSAIAIMRATAWDTFGRVPDRTGYIQRLLSYMPQPNSYSSTGVDGLNRAAFASIRRQTGLDTEDTFSGALFGHGLGLDAPSVTRRMFHLKIDQNVRSSTRVSAGVDIEKDRNSRTGLQSLWPDGVDGYSIRQPRVFVLNALSTLSQTMVNEARFGISHNRSAYLAPWDDSVGETNAALAQSFLQQGWTDPRNGRATPVYYRPGAGAMNFSGNIVPSVDVNASGPCQGGATLSSSQSCETGSTLYQFANTFSKNQGNHSIRSGLELRFTRAWEVESTSIPSATGGPSANTSSELASLTAFPELQGRLQAAATDSASLLYFLSGSVANISQPFWANSIDNFTNGTWETWSNGEGKKIRRTDGGEFAFFVKDDWRVSKKFSLNLGVRYENYGNQHTRGFAAGIQDAGYGLFGPSRMRGPGDPFDYWLTPGQNYVTGYGFVAPAIDVAGALLPNGAPAYVPGGCGNSASTCVGQAAGGSLTSTVACVYGVQQSPLLPVSTCDPSLLTTHIFVGPGSSHPNTAPLYRDGNNFGPAVGFSLRLPGPGTRTMLIRGGIQTTYDSAKRNLSVASGVGRQLGQIPGMDSTLLTCDSAVSCLGIDRGGALTLADLPNVTPFAPAYGPAMDAFVVVGTQGNGNVTAQDWGAQRAVSATAFAPDYRDPYTTNVTFSVSMNLSRRTTLAVSYVGTLGRKRPTAVDLNTPNVYNNPELLDALVRTRAGEDAPLFDQMFAGLNLSGLGAANGYGNVGTCVAPTAGFAPGPGGGAGNCPAGTYYQSGSAHLRRSSAFQTDLANGNFAAVASTLATFGEFSEGSVISSSTDWGQFLKGRAVRNGCDRLANATSSNRTDLISGNAGSGNTGAVRCFPEDYIIANPTLDAAAYKANWGFTNYHHLQTQFMMRMSTGVAFQATYVFSKLLALPRDFYKTNTAINDPDVGLSSASVTGFSDPRTSESRRRDYGLSSSNFTHAFHLNSGFRLPFGVGQPLFPHPSPWLGRVVGGWQIATVFNAHSGQPFSIVAADMLYGSSRGAATPSGLVNPDVVSPLWQTPQGHYRRNAADGSSNYFGNPSPLMLIRDPQCDRNVGPNLSALCTLKALAIKVAPGTPGAFPVGTGSSDWALLMLQNPLPGHQGTLGSQSMTQPRSFSFDASLSKEIVFRETTTATFSLEALNALNHSTASDVLINLGPGGILSDRSDGVSSSRFTVPRRIEMSLRLSF